MMIDEKLLVVLVSLALVCVISILGSFAHFIGNQFDGRCSGDPDRWKWMCTTGMLFMLIGMFIV